MNEITRLFLEYAKNNGFSIEKTNPGLGGIFDIDENGLRHEIFVGSCYVVNRRKCDVEIYTDEPVDASYYGNHLLSKAA